ncbi:phosphotransferase [Georgenia sp. TF02-10]|uniref:phosphotransferase n=1 Tax=Georgenia sp. TF02-10 TaxID=2917725 RepID=UPI001FA6C0C6|nr:phosphotransferase [Georgenia sp. TF02-10]UNX54157.1 phosphotransferase [Georgenia sp. TF02-10]
MVRSALALAALATTALPGLDVVATRPPQRVGADFQTTGILDAGGRHWVVLAPLHPAAGAALEGEVALLGNLAAVVDAGRLPFDVPRPEGFAVLPEGGRAMVYRQLVGRPLDLDRLTAGPGLSAEVGRAIAALHELDVAVVADSGLPVYDAETYRTRCLAEVDEAARTGHVPAVLLSRWERALEDVALWRFRTTPVHGDLAPEQVLVHEGRVSALLGLAEAHVGDPAEDLAWLVAAAPEESLDAIEEAYAMARTEGADAHLIDRALLVAELALARWLLHGVRTGDPAVVEDAARMLRELAEDVADAPPIGAAEPVVRPAEGYEPAEGYVPDDGDRGVGASAGRAAAPVGGAGATAAGATADSATAAGATAGGDGAGGDPAAVTEELNLGAALPDFLREEAAAADIPAPASTAPEDGPHSGDADQPASGTAPVAGVEADDAAAPAAGATAAQPGSEDAPAAADPAATGMTHDGDAAASAPDDPSADGRNKSSADARDKDA